MKPMPETIMVADKGEVIAVVRTMQDAVDLFRLMKDRLGLTNEFIDDVGGLTKGHADKILGPSEAKRLGIRHLRPAHSLTAVEFRVHIDMDAVKRMEAIWEKRERPLYPHANVKRISKKLIERAKPHVMQEIGARWSCRQDGYAKRGEHRSPRSPARQPKPGMEEGERRSAALGRSCKAASPQLHQPSLACPIDAHPARSTPSAYQMPADPR
jgi:hypothetical protein